MVIGLYSNRTRENGSHLSIIVSYNKYYYSKKHNGREWDRTTDLVINSHTRYLLRHSTCREVSLHLLRRTFKTFLNASIKINNISFCSVEERLYIKNNRRTSGHALSYIFLSAVDTFRTVLNS